MADYPSILVQLHHNLQILREREARYAGQAPLELVNQIEDHLQAIELTGRWERGELSETDWHAAIDPLLVNIRQRRGEAAVSINIGAISGGMHGSIIAGGDVNAANLFNTGDVSGSYNVIGHGAQLVIRQIEHLSPAELARRDEDVYARQLAQAIKARVAGFQRLVKKSVEARLNPYKSLNYYGLEDAPFFTGREQAVSSLLGQIHQHRLTILFADSGAGKSSLLQAGIAARLLAAGHLPIVIRLHGREPVSLTVRKNVVPELGAAPADTVDYSVDRIRFSPDERYVMTLGHTRIRRRNISQPVRFIYDARIWEIDSAQPLFVSGGNTGAAVTPDGMWLATLKQDGMVWLHTTNVLPEDYRVKVGAKILAAGFGPAGKTVWVRNEAGRQSRDITTGARLDSAPPETATRPDAPAPSSPNGRYSVITENQVKIIDTVTGVEQLIVPNGTLVEFGPGNRVLAIAEPGDISVKLISLVGDEPVTLEGHTGRVNAMSFSPDGSRLVTASEDGTARLWITATGETVAILPGGNWGVTGAAFSTDARQVLTFGPDGIIRVWANPTIPEMIETATKRIRPSWQAGRIE